MGRFEDSLKWTLTWEGGFVDDPDDPGGRTMKGVTQAVYNTYLASIGKPPADVKDIHTPELQAIYQKYWDASHAGAFEYGLAQALFDTAVNFGSGRAIQFLNQVLGVGDSTKVSKSTMDAIRKLAKEDHSAQIEAGKAICQKRIDYRHARVAKSPKLAKFLKGWLRRDNALLDLVGRS